MTASVLVDMTRRKTHLHPLPSHQVQSASEHDIKRDKPPGSSKSTAM
jgi:hypothetical protein